MKPYVKPELHYENFELSHTIANCGISMNHKDIDGCKYDSTMLPGLKEGETVFTEDSTCKYGWNKFEGYCLQTGSGSFNLFTS